MSTPRALNLPDRVVPRTARTRRGTFAVLEATPVRGVSERRSALLVPGYTGSKEDFLAILVPLAAGGRTVIAMDQRGQHQSTPAASRAGYAPAELGADLLAVAEAVAGDSGPPHLVGHSFGGLIAREAALAGWRAFTSLTLLDSGPGSVPGVRAQRLREVLDFADPARSADVGDRSRLGELIAKVWHERFEPEARADGTPEHIIDFLRQRTLATCPLGLTTMGAHLLDFPDRSEDLAAIADLPKLVIYGENDDAWPPAVQDLMGRTIGAERICIPGAAHSPPVEAPDATASALTAFWNEAERKMAAAGPMART